MNPDTSLLSRFAARCRFLPVSLLGVTGIDLSEVAGNICN